VARFRWQADRVFDPLDFEELVYFRIGETRVSPEINARDLPFVSFNNRLQRALPPIGVCGPSRPGWAPPTSGRVTPEDKRRSCAPHDDDIILPGLKRRQQAPDLLQNVGNLEREPTHIVASDQRTADCTMPYLAKALLTGAGPLPLITTEDPAGAPCGATFGPAHSR
jgi:hypothetical protein